MSALSEELERLAIGDWPALQSEEFDGWLLRYSAGVTMRGNSVAVGTRVPSQGLDCALDEVDRRYAARGLSPCFQLFDHAPPALDAALAANSYAVEGGSWVLTASCVPVTDAHRTETLRTEVRDVRDREWLAIAAGRSRFGPDAAAFEGFVERVGARAGHAIAHLDGVPVAASLGVLTERWLGIYAMITVPEARRHGAARAMVDALLSWAHSRGAEQAYLLVGEDNAGAIELYRRAGFTTQARYWYRRREVAGVHPPSGC